MVVLNGMSRYHLAVQALRRARRIPEGAEQVIQHCEQMLARYQDYVVEHLEDMPEVQGWPAGALTVVLQAVRDLDREPDVVVHRFVHGGLRHAGPALVDDTLLAELDALVPLAPCTSPARCRWRGPPGPGCRTPDRWPASTRPCGRPCPRPYNGCRCRPTSTGSVSSATAFTACPSSTCSTP